MKKYSLVIILLLHSAFSIAQKKHSMGLHGGLNINSATGTGINKNYDETFNSFIVGYHFNTVFSKHFSIRTLTNYEQNGWMYKGLTTESPSFPLAPTDYTFKMNYFSTYVLPEYSFGKKVSFSLNAGPYIGILLKDKMRIEFKNRSGTVQSVINTSSDNKRKINAGIAVGAGLQTDLSKKISIRLDARNNFGLTNVSKGDAKIRLNTLAFSAGIGYYFKEFPFNIWKRKRDKSAE